MPDLRIAIAGAGLAGLALAQMLHRHGIDTIVFERDADHVTRNPGYRLHINATGTSALDAVLEPRLRRLFVATAGSPRQVVLNFDEQLNPGRSRDLSGPAATNERAGEIPEHLVADRSTMRRILLTGLEQIVRFNSPVTGYHCRGTSGVTVHLADGASVEADALIGADGINSAVRTVLLPHAEVIDLQARHIAAKIPLTGEAKAAIADRFYSVFTLISNRQHETVTFAPLVRSDPTSLLIKECDPDFQDEVSRDFALVIFSAPAALMPTDAHLYAASPDELRRYALERVASWHPDAIDLVRRWDLDTVQPLTLRSSVPPPAWEPTNVTVVGDAIHAMSPALGIGANTALRDAQTLGAELLAAAAGTKSLPAAIGDYERAMRNYAYEAVRASARMGEHVIGHRPLPE